MLITFMQATAMVLVLIPPPVEAGEAPIHISSMKISVTGSVMAAVSTELKPAVRVVTDPKNETTNFPKKLRCSVSVLLYSNKKMKTVPDISRMAVVVIITFEFRLSTQGK